MRKLSPPSSSIRSASSSNWSATSLFGGVRVGIYTMLRVRGLPAPALGCWLDRRSPLRGGTVRAWPAKPRRLGEHDFPDGSGWFFSARPGRAIARPRRDASRRERGRKGNAPRGAHSVARGRGGCCLLYTSDAAYEQSD